jgi:hypothetical protein
MAMKKAAAALMLADVASRTTVTGHGLSSIF